MKTHISVRGGVMPEIGFSAPDSVFSAVRDTLERKTNRSEKKRPDTAADPVFSFYFINSLFQNIFLWTVSGSESDAAVFREITAAVILRRAADTVLRRRLVRNASQRSIVAVAVAKFLHRIFRSFIPVVRALAVNALLNDVVSGHYFFRRIDRVLIEKEWIVM